MVNPFGQSVPYPGTGWVPTGTPGQIIHNTLLERVDLNVTINGTNDTIVKDMTDVSALGEPISDTDWRLRLSLNWPTFNSFRNTDVANEGTNILIVGLSDTDQTSNMFNGDQKFAGVLIQNFDGNDPTPAIRAGGSPVPPNGFRGLLLGRVKDGAVQTNSTTFTPGGQPGAQSTTPIEIIRSGTLLTINLYAFNTSDFGTPVETQTMTVPATVAGLQFLKCGNFDLTVANPSSISGFLLAYELLNGGPVPQKPGTPTSLYSKLHGET